MNTIKRLCVWLAQAAVGLFFMAVLLVAVAEWSVGCGESYVDAKGKTHVGKCLFIKR